jgi:ribosomal protein S27AE
MTPGPPVRAPTTSFPCRPFPCLSRGTFYHRVMGRTYLFECGKCGYRATVAGGVERGPQLVVQTIHCLECRELHDAVIELKVPAAPAAKLSRWKLKPTPFDSDPGDEKPPTFAAALHHLVVGRDQSFRWMKFKLACPVSPRHRLRVWQQPGKCPRCGIFLDGSGTPFKVWD